MVKKRNKFKMRRIISDITRGGFNSYILVFIMSITFVVLGALFIMMYTTGNLVKYFVERPEVIGFFKDDTKEEDILNIKLFFEKEEYVSSVKYVSKEDAMKNFINSDPENKKIIESVEANILPAHINVRVKDLSFLDQVKKNLENKESIEDVRSFDESEINVLKKIILGVEIFGISLFLVFTLSTITILFLVIGINIYSKKDEIGILSLVGASIWYIRYPFLIQSFVYILISIIISNIILVPILVIYYDDILSFITGNIISVSLNYIVILIGIVTQLLFGLLIAFFCTYIATKRYLKY